MALSLGGLRRKIEIAMLPNDVRVVLQLDGLAERERHRRRAQAQLSRIAQLDQRTALAANVCTRRKRTCGPKEEARIFGFFHFFASHFSHNLRGAFAERGLS